MTKTTRERLDESCAQYLSDLKEHRVLFDAWRRASEALVKARASGDHTLIVVCREALDRTKHQLQEWEKARFWNANRRTYKSEGGITKLT